MTSGNPSTPFKILAVGDRREPLPSQTCGTKSSRAFASRVRPPSARRGFPPLPICRAAFSCTSSGLPAEPSLSRRSHDGRPNAICTCPTEAHTRTLKGDEEVPSKSSSRPLIRRRLDGTARDERRPVRGRKLRIDAAHRAGASAAIELCGNCHEIDVGGVQHRHRPDVIAGLS